MIRSTNKSYHMEVSASRLFIASLFFAVAGCTSQSTNSVPAGDMLTGDAKMEQILAGRYSVLHHDCGGCHGGGSNPASPLWLAGARTPLDEFQIGPFKTRPRNLTPDNQTGLGRFSERQIFNSLRYGLRPGETPDVEITSSIPGQGNFPVHPRYLAQPMPWTAWRHMPDKELWAIAAYLKNGLKPVVNKVQDSEGPPDFWASTYVSDSIGTYPSPPFPTARERAR